MFNSFNIVHMSTISTVMFIIDFCRRGHILYKKVLFYKKKSYFIKKNCSELLETPWKLNDDEFPFLLDFQIYLVKFSSIITLEPHDRSASNFDW